MAKEYIERAAALKAMEWTWCGKAAFDKVKEIPAADVAPIKRGRWLKRDDMPWIVECKCSVCGYADYPTKSDRYWFERNYCPNCGAKMEVNNDD